MSMECSLVLMRVDRDVLVSDSSDNIKVASFPESVNDYLGLITKRLPE